MDERQEIHCHACGKWVQFNIDTEMDGKHVLDCPSCGHEHCRFVDAGRITDQRWDQRNGDLDVYAATGITVTSGATFTVTATSGYYFLNASWANTTTAT